MTYFGNPRPWWPPVSQFSLQPSKQTGSQQTGTLLQVHLPAGSLLNLGNLLEVATPEEICLLVRIPALDSAALANWLEAIRASGGAQNILDAIRQAGGTVETL